MPAIPISTIPICAILLSDAVRLGSLLMREPERGITQGCAIGMVLLAHNIEPNGKSDYERVRDLYPWIDGSCGECAWCGSLLSGMRMLAHNFEAHVMSGEATIDGLCSWIASIEPGPNRDPGRGVYLRFATPEAKSLIRAAARLAGVSLENYLVRTAMRAAEIDTCDGTLTGKPPRSHPQAVDLSHFIALTAEEKAVGWGEVEVAA